MQDSTTANCTLHFVVEETANHLQMRWGGGFPFIKYISHVHNGSISEPELIQ